METNRWNFDEEIYPGFVITSFSIKNIAKGKTWWLANGDMKVVDYINNIYGEKKEFLWEGESAKPTEFSEWEIKRRGDFIWESRSLLSSPRFEMAGVYRFTLNIAANEAIQHFIASRLADQAKAELNIGVFERITNWICRAFFPDCPHRH